MRGFFKRIRDAWSRYLKRLAEENRKNFGDEPLYCCSLKKDGKERRSG